MARRTIHFSDLTSQPILDDAHVIRVVVLDHPALGGDAVEFEAAASELADIDMGARDVAVIELHSAGDQPPRRVVLDVAVFDKLAADQPMEELLANATPARSNGRADRPAASRNADRVNYATLERAGEPHKGKMTEAEARLVRENLDVINARLAASGQRTIDPADPKMRERYGFGQTGSGAAGGAPSEAPSTEPVAGPAGSEVQPAVSGDQTTALDVPPPAPEDQTAVFDMRPAPSEDQTAAFDVPPAVSADRTAAFDASPAAPDSQPAGSDGQPAAIDDRPTTSGDRKAASEHTTAPATAGPARPTSAARSHRRSSPESAKSAPAGAAT